MKTIVITGGATGIGFETAKACLKTGEYDVALVGRRKARLEEAAQALSEFSDGIKVYTGDLRNPNDLAACCDRIRSQNEEIYGLVNNAGIYPFGGLESTSWEDWDMIFNINLRAAFLMCKALVPDMEKTGLGGRILNISSTAGVLPNHFALAYSVSKAALIHFTKTLAKELGPKDITVNCICPGIIRSPLHETYHESKRALEDFYEKKGATLPLGRVGKPQDMVGAILFFLSDQASWVTGDNFILDGGRLLT